MKTINVHEAKTHLSRVLAEMASTGEGFLICRNGEPVADLVPHRKRARLALHPEMKTIRLRYDPSESLSPEEWPVEDKGT